MNEWEIVKSLRELDCFLIGTNAVEYRKPEAIKMIAADLIESLAAENEKLKQSLVAANNRTEYVSSMAGQGFNW